jgi:hypothetical protein
MSEAPFSAFRKEVQRYLRSCEHLVAATLPPFSQDELTIMKFYVAEIEKILAASTKK